MCTHAAAGALLALLLFTASPTPVCGQLRFIAFTPAGGNNNVRNALFGAIELAWVTQRYSSAATMGPNAATTDKAGNTGPCVVVPDDVGGSASNPLTVFNFSHLNAKTGLCVIAAGSMSAADTELAKKDWNDGRCHFNVDVSAAWLKRINQLIATKACKNGARFVHASKDSAGLYDEEWQAVDIRAFYAAVRFQDHIVSVSESLRQQLPKDFLAVHYRAGDKSPMPLFNCSKYGFTRAGLRARSCTHKHDGIRAIVTYEEVLLDLWKVRAPRTIFVATHVFNDERYVLFQQLLTRMGLTIVTLPDLIATLEKKDNAQHARLQEMAKSHRFLSSWIDQYLCAQADVFLPAAASTWTQLVMIMRREMGKPDADKWMSLYTESFRLYASDNPQYQYYGDGGEGSLVPANFLTRCPVGTTVTGPYCLCNNAASTCVLMPNAPAPEAGKGCLSQRRFSPLTFRRTDGFHSACEACRCDPFDGWG
jgi:hypothetical protein